MGMARFAEAMIDIRDERVVPLLHLNSSRIGEALRLAVAQAENDVGHASDRYDEVTEAIGRIREAAALRQSSEKRISDLEAEVKAAQDRARRGLSSAEDRALQAEAKASAEAERADSAELRRSLTNGRA
jgi:hypothetical protein